MIQIRSAAERGHTKHGWLESHHSFSFADYYDPAHMGWGVLRVINDDRVAPGMGFGTHGHRDMEIVSYVLSGTLQHRDNLGNGTLIQPGDVQRMSAGRGVLHSEFNPSQTEGVHFLQIWILPARRGIDPGYEQIRFNDSDKRGRLRLVASPDGRDGSVTVHQDASIHAGLFNAGEAATYALAPGRLGYLHVARGSVTLNGEAMQAGDGARISDEAALQIAGLEGGEVLLFDLPPEAAW
ncbi:pirin family protein [Niveibacterium sp. 24ML]|uniref:pirin family protein n=1 Tax=Niveibacterium sp. 24ML TaxID=2985512 RepID=UPI00226DE966|nr:pirin family protein [Niveibacterium sp. 24ML]MCX9156223.1 pirin family protein [Niveibacterium sp. 24ML]